LTAKESLPELMLIIVMLMTACYSQGGESVGYGFSLREADAG